MLNDAFVVFFSFCLLTLLLADLATADVREYLAFSDLSALDSSPDAVRSVFQRRFGKKPDGISLNNHVYYDGVDPPITEQYSRYCYKRIGEVTYTLIPGSRNREVTIGTQFVENKSSREVVATASVKGSWTESVSHTTSVTVGLTFSRSVSVKGVFEMGMEFSFETTTSETKSESRQLEQTASVQVTVPPNSKVRVDMQATMKEQDADYSAPISVSGYFGANFPSRVEGHYFWFLRASRVLPKTSGTLKGKVTGVKAFDVHTTVHDAVALDSNDVIALEAPAT